jgi:hypothetical protein
LDFIEIRRVANLLMSIHFVHFTHFTTPLYNSALVAKARQERAAAGREERQWARQQLKEQEMQDEEQAAVRAANTLFDRHMTPLRHVFKTYSSYEEKLKRCVFITAGPITKLFAGGEEESGGHVL